jgi:hypothetical protein
VIEELVRHFGEAGFKARYLALKMHWNDDGDVEEVPIEQADTITITVRKRVGERIVGYDWGISDLELRFANPSPIFFDQADRIIAQLNEAIAKEMDACKS